MSTKFIITLIFLLALVTSATGATLDEVNQVSNELIKICQANKTYCHTYITIEDSSLNAYSTEKNSIVFSRQAVNTLSKEYLKAIGLHEIGHIVYKHPQTLANLSKIPNLNLKPYRYFIEYQADEFATSYYKKHDQHNYLIDVLLTLAKDNVTKATDTHPSPENRIKRMKELYK